MHQHRQWTCKYKHYCLYSTNLTSTTMVKYYSYSYCCCYCYCLNAIQLIWIKSFNAQVNGLSFLHSTTLVKAKLKSKHFQTRYVIIQNQFTLSLDIIFSHQFLELVKMKLTRPIFSVFSAYKCLTTKSNEQYISHRNWKAWWRPPVHLFSCTCQMIEYALILITEILRWQVSKLDRITHINES